MLGPLSTICEFLPAFEAYNITSRLTTRTRSLVKEFPNIIKLHEIADPHGAELYDLFV